MPTLHRLSSLFLALLCLLTSAPGFAEDTTPRVFVRFIGESEDIAVLERSVNRFKAPLLQSSAVAFAGTVEMDRVFSECRADVGVSPTVDRECRLQAARRTFVEHVLEVGATRIGENRYEFALSVWDPDSSEQVFVTFVETEGGDLELAARDASTKLATDYLCFRGHAQHCEGHPTSTTANAIVPVEPVQPVVEQPVQPVVEQPVQPVVEQPVQPVVEQPVQPASRWPHPAYDQLAAMGFTETHLQTLIDQGATVDTYSPEIAARLMAKEFTPEDITELAALYDVFAYPRANHAEGVAAGHTIGLHLIDGAYGHIIGSLGDRTWNLTEWYNTGFGESGGLLVAEVTTGVLSGALGLTGVLLALDQDDTTATVGVLLLVGGGVSAGLCVVLSIIDAADIGALNEGTLERATKTELQEIAVQEGRAHAPLPIDPIVLLLPWGNEEGGGLGLTVVF